jgi:hypothetical protein
MNKDMMRALGFGKQIDDVEAGKCPFCGKSVKWEDFKDEISKREYRISGICQECQDKTFKEN